VVSNEEIKRMLEARRRGVDIKREKKESENFKICPHCKTKNPEKAVFCVNCGKKLDKKLKVTCPSCGTENQEDAKFCVGCGENLKKDIKEEVSDVDVEIKKLESERVEKTTPKSVSPELIEGSVPETSELISPELKKMDSDAPEKSLPKTGVPSSVPEHGLINKTGLKKVCPACKGKNLKNAKFCVVCGEKFDEQSADSKVEKSEEYIKPSLMDKVNAGEKPDTVTSEKVTAEIKVPKSIIELKNKAKEEDLDNEKGDADTVLLDETDVTEHERVENVDPIEKIKKAKELLDMGAISSEEFENIKKKYLDKI
jgi:ribosomal protein L40E